MAKKRIPDAAVSAVREFLLKRYDRRSVSVRRGRGPLLHEWVYVVVSLPDSEAPRGKNKRLTYEVDLEVKLEDSISRRVLSAFPHDRCDVSVQWI